MTNKDKKTKKELTETQQKWWNSVKDIEINYYGLPNQTVGTVCEPLNILEDCLFLLPKGPAVLRILDDILQTQTDKSVTGKKVPKFVLEQGDKYIVMKQNPELAR